MKRVVLAALFAAVAVPAALASNGEPQKAYTPADQAKAKRASLRLSDFVAGWTSRPDTSKDGANPKCKTYDPDQSDLVETGKYNSPDFTHAGGSFVSTTTGVFKTAAMAKTGYARVAQPALPKCFGELLGKQAKTTVYSASAISFPKVGERSNAYRLQVGIAASPGKTVKAAIDFVLFNKGRTDVAIIFFGVGGALPSQLEQQAAALVASRA